jgi:peptidyl-prolyl cis-trans isomerase C
MPPMSAFNTLLLTTLILVFAQSSAIAEVSRENELVGQDKVIIQDDGVSFTYDELDYIVSKWSPQMKQAAASDEGDRLELINQMFVIKKLAREADRIPAGTDAYWRLATKLMAEKRKFVVEEYAKNLTKPDMTELAAERYKTEKDKYALVPEKRISSHILFSCPPGECSREELKVEAQKVLDELRAGADFVAMVKTHSGDAGTKAKDGKFDKWIREGEPNVAGPYSAGVFEIEKIGDYSDLVSSKYGIHIIRLDGIEEQHYLPFEEVKANIISDLETEYTKLSIKDFTSKFNMTKDVVIDRAAVEKIMSAYQPKSE